MLKIFSPTDWDFGEEPADIIRMTRDGRLVGKDAQILTKRASEEFVDLAKRVKIAKDEVPIHVIAMGSTEYYGANRNGDGFKEAALKKYHDTFEKKSKWYRDHKNKDPKKSYGVVKMSYYNPEMHRVELLVALNAEKSAAERNGGFVADRELEKLAKGQDLAASMSCRIDHDVCSSCGNKAKTRAEYCDEDSCIGPMGEKRGGCKQHLAKVAADGHLIHVDNPHPDFFDISHVFRPADRIAYGNIADYLEKSAADRIIGGAERAEIMGVGDPLYVKLASVRSPVAESFLRRAYALASIEDDITSRPVEFCRAFKTAFDRNQAFPLDGESLKALADRKILLPLDNFISSLGYRDVSSVKVAEQLPTIFNRLIARDDVTYLAAERRFSPSTGPVSAVKRAWADKFAADLSLEEQHVQRRIWRSAITDLQTPEFRKPNYKSASLASAREIKAAFDYALYQLGFLSQVDDDISGLTSQLCVIHNYS